MSGNANPCSYLAQAKAIAEDAGERILAVYQRRFTVSEKQDGSPLTEADRAAHALITSRLQELTPDIPVLSEESAAVGYEQRGAWTRLWLVDPLDGTKEFVKRNDEFTVNIALIENSQPVLGVVLAPALRVAYWACRGQGAFKQGAASHPRASLCRRQGYGRRQPLASGREARRLLAERDAPTRPARDAGNGQCPEDVPGGRGYGRRLCALRTDLGMGHSRRSVRGGTGGGSPHRFRRTHAVL
jgi:hypothetical protein